MKPDINNQPASKYDGSRISTAVRADLGKLSADKAERILRVADQPKIVPPETWDEHLDLMGKIRRVHGQQS